MIINKSELSEKLKNLKSVKNVPFEIGGVQGVLYKDGDLYANNCAIAIRTVLFDDECPDETFVIPMDAIAFIEKLPNEDVEITAGKNHEVTVKCGKIKGKFPGLDPKLFPATSDENICTSANIRLAAKDVEQLVGQIMYACPEKASKPIFQGILFDGNGNGINVVACDGYRIAVNKISTTQQINVVIPREAMQKVLSVIDTENDLLIKTEKKQVIISTGDYTVYARLIDGEYINYKQAFPKDSVATFYVNKKLLADCLARSIICYGNDKGACGILRGKKGESVITISNRSKINTFEENITLDSILAADIEIGFNSKYMIEAVKASKAEDIILQFSSALSPLLVCDGQLRQMVLPMRLERGGTANA